MRRLAALVSMSLALALPRVAHAYRPFDSTDAAVAPEGELEIELGPVGYLKEEHNRYLVAPDLVLNLGIVHGWEAVLEGEHLILLDGPHGEPRYRLVDTGFFLKGVLRDGSLQDGEGPSVALELGPLLPTVNDESGIGASANLIVSQRWSALTLHVNTEVALSRAGNLDLFEGVIIEGPQWKVRPVAEIFVEREFGAAFAVSGLAGAIWQLSDELAFDAAVRLASVDGEGVFEARAGLTWACPLWTPR
jgi:hypothetical protein